MNANILTLHGIECDAISTLLKQDPAMQRYTISSETFKNLLEAIPTGHCLSVQEITLKKPSNEIVLTFDDGLISDYEAAFPILKAKDIKATFYITSTNIGKTGFCDQSQLREMSDAGMDIGSHGLTHRYLPLMPNEEAKREIRQSKEEIEQIIGREVYSYAAVGGHFKQWMLRYAGDSGYQSFATMIPGKTDITKNSILKLYRNHLQNLHDDIYVQKLIEGNRQFFLKNKLHYYSLFLPKVILGMQNYDRLKAWYSGIPENKNDKPKYQ